MISILCSVCPKEQEKLTYSTAWKIKKVIVKLSLDFGGFLTCQPSKTSASILTQKYLHLLTLELYSPVSYYDICFRGNKHGAGQAVSREWTVDKCADSYGKKSILGPILQFLVVLSSLSVSGQLRWKYWGSAVLSEPGLQDWFYKQLACFVDLVGLATSQGSFPVAVAVKVDLWRAEKQIYFVV